MPQQLKVTRTIDITGATKIGFGINGETFGGGVYYVDGIDGADGHLGTNPNYPKKTITSALASCTSDNNDYIFVKDAWAQESSWPIDITKVLVHIIGMSHPSNPWVKMNPATDNPVFKVHNVIGVEIAGFDLSGGDSTGCIEVNASQGTQIHHCWFGHEQSGGTPTHGITLVYNPHGTRISECKFMGDLGTANGTIKEDGIQSVQGNGDNYHVEILDNWFAGLAFGMDLDGADNYWIARNYFVCSNAQNGEAIKLSATCRDVAVVNNVALYGMLNTGYTYNPYLDLAANTVNNWAMNYRGNQVVEPAGI